MTNPKIEKVKASIVKTKGIIADYQAKLRELERQKIQLENDEIVAMFRREKLDEDEFKELLRSSGKDGRVLEDTKTILQEPKTTGKEENSDDMD